MTDPNHQKILDKVDASRDQAIEFLQKMIAIPSVTGDEAAIQKFVSNTMSEIGLKVDMWETDWEALKKHPGYRPVERGYEGRPNIVGDVEGHGRRPIASAQWPHRRHPGRRRRGLERRSVVGDDQERPHLWARLLRHEERRREPHPRRRNI